MDLLEYQGKQLFAKHGVPVPDGRPASAVEVIPSDEKVTAVLFNIFGGITRCDEEGRALGAEANLPDVHTESTMLGAAEKVVELAGAAA